MNLELDRSIPRDAIGVRAANRLLRIVNVAATAGNPDAPFWYLGGPMTGIPQFNFPEFDRVAKLLRDAGYNIVSPHELDNPDERSRYEASSDGSMDTPEWASLLSRDCVIVSMPTCQGGIFLPGWHRSSGANLESHILSRLDKKVIEFTDDGNGENVILTELFDRDARIRDLNAVDDAIESVFEHTEPPAVRTPPWTLVRMDDWQVLYSPEGEATVEGHSIDVRDLVREIGVPLNLRTVKPEVESAIARDGVAPARLDEYPAGALD